jgi:hypothetical protein
MNAKTLEAVRRHGESILAAFPNTTEKDPVALCKKLRRIETVAHNGATAHCNGETLHIGIHDRYEFSSDENAWGKFSAMVLKRVMTLFGSSVPAYCGLFVNGDARGYALKLNDEWTRNWNHRQYVNNTRLPIYTDMGGYGILAPDLTVE